MTRKPDHLLVSSEDSPDSELMIKCPHSSCSYKCKSKSTLRSHRFRHHKSTSPIIAADNNFSEPIDQQPCSSARSSFYENIESQETQVSNDGYSTSANLNPEEMISKKLVHIYLTLASKFHLPDSTLEYIITAYHLLLERSLELLSTKLPSKLDPLEINCDSVKPLIESTFAQDILIQLHSADGPMRSRYMRREQYTKLFKYVIPESRNLGLNENNVSRKYHYVPIGKTLQALFEDESVYEQYTERKNRAVMRSHDLITDIEDGSLFQTHPVLSSDPSSIQLIIYQDDIEIVNPLGSGKGVYKLSVYYYTLSNLHPWSPSSIDPLQLILLCRETDVAYFGMPCVLTPLIEELISLENHGLEIRGQKLQVNTIVLLGDNLGTHTVSGFMENFSTAKYFCRYCEEMRDEWLLRMYQVRPDDRNNQQSDLESEASSSDTDISCDTNFTNEENYENYENQRVFCPIACDSSKEEEEVEERSMMNTEGDVDEKDQHFPFPAAMRTKESYNSCIAELANKPEGLKGIVADSQFNTQIFSC